MHLVLRPMRLPLLPLDLGPARGVEVSLVARLVRASALLSPRLLRELGREELLVHSGRPLPALLPRLPLPAHHSTLCDVESFRRSAPVHDPPMFPDLWIEEQGRIVEPALARRLGEIGRGPRTATGLGGIALGVTGCDLLIATGLGESVRDPLLVGEVAVTARGHALPLAALVIALGRLSPLAAHGQRIEASEPLLKNVSGPYPKKSSTTSVTLAFPHLFAPMAL